MGGREQGKMPRWGEKRVDSFSLSLVTVTKRDQGKKYARQKTSPSFVLLFSSRELALMMRKTYGTIHQARKSVEQGQRIVKLEKKNDVKRNKTNTLSD